MTPPSLDPTGAARHHHEEADRIIAEGAIQREGDRVEALFDQVAAVLHERGMLMPFTAPMDIGEAIYDVLYNDVRAKSAAS